MYRNWPEICKLKSENQWLMLAIAFLDLDSILAKKLSCSFPEYFSETPVQGPVPLSVLKEAGKAAAAKQGTTNEEYLQSLEVLKEFNIPWVEFAITNEAVEEWNSPLLPQNIDPDARFGNIVEWNGSKFVVMENNDSCELLEISPFECVDIDK